jgi:hypothetical protein
MTHRLILLAAAAGLLTFPAAAPADVLKPVVVLGPTTVLNGTAVVSGVVGVPSSVAQLTVNGQPVGIAANGTFTAIVNLADQSNLSLAIRNANGETTTTNIPLTTNIVGPGGLISPGVLADLEHAAVSLLKPLAGFKILDGLPLRIEGSVLDKDKLVGLEVNGKDVLGQLLGGDHTFTVEVPGTTKAITVDLTDQKGVSQETQIPVQHQTTQPSAPAVTPVGRTVEASQALGLRIAAVRYYTKGIKRTKRLRVVVTIKDRRGFLVRSASVGVRSAKVRWIARNPKAKKTNVAGRASFVLKAGNRAFGRRLRLVIIAKTPQGKARKASSVRLPRLARSPAKRRG